MFKLFKAGGKFVGGVASAVASFAAPAVGFIGQVWFFLERFKAQVDARRNEQGVVVQSASEFTEDVKNAWALAGIDMENAKKDMREAGGAWGFVGEHSGFFDSLSKPEDVEEIKRLEAQSRTLSATVLELREALARERGLRETLQAALQGQDDFDLKDTGRSDEEIQTDLMEALGEPQTPVSSASTGSDEPIQAGGDDAARGAATDPIPVRLPMPETGSETKGVPKPAWPEQPMPAPVPAPTPDPSAEAIARQQLLTERTGRTADELANAVRSGTVSEYLGMGPEDALTDTGPTDEETNADIMEAMGERLAA